MTSTSGTHPSLIGRVQEHNPEAWHRLVVNYTPLVMNWCQRMGCDQHTSEDIAQETFMAASRSIADLRTDGAAGSFRRWLWQIAKNKLIDLRRRYPASVIPPGGSTAAMQLLQVADSEQSVAHENLPDSDPSSPELLRELTIKALDLVRVEFHETSWKAFWRTAVDGLPTDVVASELGTTPASVRQSRSRIMRRLRMELGDLDVRR
jgi:RNA polymerase sigma-70 factor (ECF subfamily)